MRQERVVSRVRADAVPLWRMSIDAYFTGAGLGAIGSFADAYNSGKAALRGYANNLDTALRAVGTSVRVSTVNPYVVNTAIATYPHPIYTQPVNNSGLSDTDSVFNSAVTFLQQLLASGLPPSIVGETYTQLLRMTDPEPNVVVASPHGPLATQGANAIIEPAILAENQTSAVPFTCGS